jgi:serine/threonine protein kinase
MNKPRSSPQPITALNRIGRFSVTCELGRGSIGAVYLAHDPIIDRPVAIKTFNARLSQADRRQYEQQFINEARTTGRLAHPNIVTIYDVSMENGTTFIAMEYLQGSELNKLLEKGSPFSYDDIAAIAWKVADALDYAHRNGVIHRDVKPANIFIVGNNQPKVVDFGIARSPNRLKDSLLGDSKPFTLFNGGPLGTPNYMSPEQAMGKQVDRRTDIYSLGAVLYEMLTGRRPFQSTSREQLLQTIAHKAPPPPHEVNPKIPMALSKIVVRAMAKKPEKRYESAEEMALELKRYLTYERRVRRQERLKEPEEAPGAAAKNEALRGKPSWWIGAGAALVAAAAVYVTWHRLG